MDPIQPVHPMLAKGLPLPLEGWYTVTWGKSLNGPETYGRLSLLVAFIHIIFSYHVFTLSPFLTFLLAMVTSQEFRKRTCFQVKTPIELKIIYVLMSQCALIRNYSANSANLRSAF